ncbi:hypothetical protein SO802_014432 [Lithocarpus litseifolius]|uniref:DUF4283 domain-containing protein n=1 Tax=Lithocarpus litseifolius TaxID=425828 RepID=A0AAW2CW35_9ROSI
MDMEADSDEEVEELCEGLAESKLNLLWKSAGSLDCVDLGKEFYSVGFSLKEDMDAVLKNEPWFVTGHFLSIRPWEPLFKPSCISVSSITVWVRLQELPMELYEVKVLKQISEAIGRVLRIDSHIAMEARRRYARICIHPSDQANARIQHLCRGEGVDFGSGGTAIDSMSREGKNKGEDGLDGMEFEEVSRDFVSSE